MSTVTPDISNLPRVVLGLCWRKRAGKTEFLLSQRNAPNTTIHGLWQIPGGGVEADESDEQALKRELREELGLFPTIDLAEHKVSLGSYTYPDGRRLLFGLVMYLCEIQDQVAEIQPGEDETLAVEWFTPEQITKLNSIENTQAMVDWAIDRLIYYANK